MPTKRAHFDAIAESGIMFAADVAAQPKEAYTWSVSDGLNRCFLEDESMIFSQMTY